jgi:hypothetical protein
MATARYAEVDAPERMGADARDQLSVCQLPKAGLRLAVGCRRDGAFTLCRHLTVKLGEVHERRSGSAMSALRAVREHRARLPAGSMAAIADLNRTLTDRSTAGGPASLVSTIGPGVTDFRPPLAVEARQRSDEGLGHCARHSTGSASNRLNSHVHLAAERLRQRGDAV